MTAVSNDFGYDNVFERQVEALGQPGDIFLGISTSGNSVSLVRALEMCRKKGVTSVGYLGNKGGAMAPLCDYCVIVPSNITMHIQESHLALEHALCALVERFYFGEDFDSDPPRPAK
jgi:D-sedoheptulose 7-phosphate isomerase